MSIVVNFGGPALRYFSTSAGMAESLDKLLKGNKPEVPKGHFIVAQRFLHEAHAQFGVNGFPLLDGEEGIPIGKSLPSQMLVLEGYMSVVGKLRILDLIERPEGERIVRDLMYWTDGLGKDQALNIEDEKSKKAVEQYKVLRDFYRKIMVIGEEERQRVLHAQPLVHRYF